MPHLEYPDVKGRKDRRGSKDRWSECRLSHPRERPAAPGAELDYRGRRSRTIRKGPRGGWRRSAAYRLHRLVVGERYRGPDLGNPTYHLQRERLMRTERLSSLQTVIFSILYSENGSSYAVKNDPTVARIAAKWARGDIKGIKRVEELLAQAGLSMADVDLQSLSDDNPRNLIGSTSVTSALPGVATRFCGKSSGDARAGRSWCGARARKLSKGNSMNCHRAHPMLSPTCPTQAITGPASGRTRKAHRQETAP